MLRPNRGAVIANRELDRVARDSRVKREARLASLREVREMISEKHAAITYDTQDRYENAVLADIDALIKREEEVRP